MPNKKFLVKSLQGGDHMVYLRLNEILKEKGKSKSWFVRKMEGDYHSISNLIENTSISIHYSTIDRICNVLECEPGDLFVKKDKF